MIDADLSPDEQALVAFLAVLASARAGTLARQRGHAEPNEEQVREMGRLQIQALTAFVVGVREVIEGVALGVLDRVMGPKDVSLH